MKAPARSSYPEKVLIGAAQVPYEIILVSDKKWLGKCSYKKRRIYLNDWLTNEQLFMAFIHELLHAIEFETGSRIPHKVIYRFEEGLYLFFINNLTHFGFKGDT